MWVTTTIEETGKLPPYKFSAHGPWKTMKGVGKMYCLGCGLIKLNNPLTQWCIKMGCDHDLHSSYKSKCKNLGRR